MMGFRLALPVTLAFIVVMLTGVGIAAAQEDSQGLAPSNLNARICNTGWQSVCLSWTLGTDDYHYQEIWFWETGATGPFSKASQITPHSVSSVSIPLFMVNQYRMSSLLNGGASFTFQIVGVKFDSVNFDYSGFSNQATLHIPGTGVEPLPEQQPENEPPALEEPDESELPTAPEESEDPEANTGPSNLRASQDAGAVNLTWNPANAPYYVSQVVLRREATRGTSLEVIHTFTQESGEMDIGGYTDTTAEAGKRYVYRIKALKANGKGPMTNAAKITVQ